MSQTYNYSISLDFPNGAVDPDSLTRQIESSSISTGVLEGITLRTPDPDTCYITFDVALSAGDVTTLDGVVAAHTGVPDPPFENSDAVDATFNLVGATADAVPMMTLNQKNVSGEYLYMRNAVDDTDIVRFRQSPNGNPIFTLRNAAGINICKLSGAQDAFINSPGGFGVNTSVPNPAYAIDIVGDVNTDSAYRVGDVVVVSAGRDLTNVRTANFTGEFDNGSQSGPNYTVDWSNGQKQVVTLTGSPTLSFTAPPGVGNFLLRIVQDVTGGRTITWPSSVKWSNGTAPSLSGGAGAEDIVSFYYNGTDYYGVASLNFS
jgi:hypothetical protein